MSILRYVISSAAKGLKYGDDGSLTVTIQHESPGTDQESNWLPAPDGPFLLQARLYWPTAVCPTAGSESKLTIK